MQDVLATYPVVLSFFRARLGLRGVDHAEDLTQETMLAALEGIARGPKIESVPRYVLRIARNKLCDWLERAQRPDRRASPLSELSGDSFPVLVRRATIEARLLEYEQRRSLLDALGQLSARDRRLLTLRFLHEVPNAAAARRLGIDPVHASRLTYKALQRLRRALQHRDARAARQAR